MLRKDSTKDRAITGSQELPRRRKSPGPFDLTRRSGPPPKKSDAHDKKIGGKRKNVVAGPNVDARDREVDDMRNAKRKRDEERVVHLDALKGRHLFVEGVNQKNNAGSFWDLKDLEIGWRTEADLIGDHDRLHLLPQPTEVLTRTLASSAFQRGLDMIFSSHKRSLKKNPKNMMQCARRWSNLGENIPVNRRLERLFSTRQ